MEIIFWIIGLVLSFVVIGGIIEIVSDWYNSISWGRFFGVLIFGTVVLSVLFSFTSESIVVIIGALLVLIIGALFFASVKTKSNSGIFDDF